MQMSKVGKWESGKVIILLYKIGSNIPCLKEDTE